MTTLDPHALAELVRKNPMFDAQWYQREYPEIEYHADGNPDPAFHYANYGYKESRLPSVLFDGNKYSDFHNLRDVNPLVHYLEHGARGDYRVNARLPEILTKVSLGLELLPSERLYYLEHFYSTNLKQDFDLANQAPVTLNEKLLYLHAFGEGKSSDEISAFATKALALQDSTQQAQALKDLGLSDEALSHVQSPAVVLKSAKDLELAKLPENFRVKCNGYATQIYMHNKSRGKLPVLQNLFAQEQQRAAVFLQQDALSPLYQLTPDLLVYDLAPLMAHAPKNAVPSKVELWCVNGKVAYSLLFGSAGSNTVAIYDRDFKLQASALSTPLGNYRIAPVEKCACFDQLVAFAEQCARDRAFLSVSFLTTGEDYVLEDISLYPYNNIFVCSNDFSLKAAAQIELTK